MATRKPVRKTSTKARKTLSVEDKTAPWDKLKKLSFPTGKIVPLDIPWGNKDEARYSGAKYVSGAGWFIDESIMSESLSRFASRSYSWDRLVADIASGDKPKVKPGTLETGSFKLRLDQEEDRDKITSTWKSGGVEFGLFSSTGVGKTVTSIAAVNAMKGKLVVVFCPKSVMASWARTIEAMGDGGKKWVIINYESSKKLLKPTKAPAAKAATNNKNLALHGIPWIKPDFVICDESHKLKNPISQMSRTVEKIISADGAKILRVTATPAEDPSQMHYLWRGLSFSSGDPLAGSTNSFDQYVKWANRNGITGLAKAPFGDGIIYNGGPEGIEKMNELMYEGPRPWTLRRKPEGWPEQKRTGMPIWLSPEDKDLYEQEWRDFLDKSVKLKKIIQSDRVSKAIKKRAKSEGLVAYTRYRQKTGLLKVPHATLRAKELAADNIQVVLACSFKVVAEAIAAELDKSNISYELLTGEVTGEAREEARLRFQRGEVKAVICSITTGISLHQNETGIRGASSNERRLLAVEIMQSGLEQFQLEGRVTRDGVMNVCEYLYASGTIDEKITTSLLKKMSSMAKLHKEEVVSFHDLAEELGLPSDFMS